MIEKGRLYILKKDGSKDSVHLNIKNKRFLFGSSEHSNVRIYIDGIFPEHCLLTVRGQEKAYLEPLHPSALTLVNGVKIKNEIILEENDVITILKKSFLFSYPQKILSINVCLERLLASPNSKQLNPDPKFESSTLGKSWIFSNPCSESSISNINNIPKQQLCLVGSDILKEIPNYLLKFTPSEPLKSAQKFGLSTLGKSWITSNPCSASGISKKQICLLGSDTLNEIPNYSLKFRHLKPLKSTQKFGLSTLGKSWITSNPCSESNVSNLNFIPRKQICLVGGDILKEIPNCVLKFTHQETISILYEKINVPEVDFRSNKCMIKCMNQYVKESFESRRNSALKLYKFIIFLRDLLNRNVDYINDIWLLLKSILKFCNVRANEDILFLPFRSLNFNGEAIIQKASLQSRISLCAPKSSKNLAISYKKRVSLAVRRYNLRRRKSIMMTKTAESGSDEIIELSGGKVQLKDECRENSSDKQDILNIERQKPTRTKKRVCNKKGKELQEQGLQTREKVQLKDGSRENNSDKEGVVLNLERQKTTRTKKRGCNKKEKELQEQELQTNPEKENIAELAKDSSQIQITVPKGRKQKQLKGKQSSKNRGLKEESNDLDKEQTSTTKSAEKTKRSYKKKEPVTNYALSDKMETKFSCGSPMKQNPLESNELKPKKVDYRKKEMPLQKKDSSKSNQEQETQLSRCQRVTRSMVKSRH